MLKTDVAVVGAGIVGLAHALAAARRGLKVTLFERNERAVGASIRNFGLSWPVGLALTPLYARALRSRSIWLETARQAGYWVNENGSLFIAYHADEQAVLLEFIEAAHDPAYQWLNPDRIKQDYPAVRSSGLIGGFLSSTELTVDPREAIRVLPGWLERTYGIVLRFGTSVNTIESPYLETIDETWRAGHIFVCNGPDLETFYPEIYAESGITRCKLQMMRLAPPVQDWRLGPTLASGLTLSRYDNFSVCPGINALRARLHNDWPEQTSRGIHVLLAQNGLGELLVGDTHEYGLTFDPFDSEYSNNLILDYLETFASLPEIRVLERWHGIYPKLDGQSEFVAYPDARVTLVQITNGLGMTLAFGLAEEILHDF